VIARLSKILNRNLGQAFETKGRQPEVVAETAQEKPASPELANQTVGSSAKSEEAAKNRHVQTQADCSRPKTAAQWRSAAKAAARSSDASAFHD
jgi:hypothetical protein